MIPVRLWSEMILIQVQENRDTQHLETQLIQHRLHLPHQHLKQQLVHLLAVLRCLSLHLQHLHHLQQLLRQLLISTHKALKVPHQLNLKQVMLAKPWQEAQQL